MNEMAEKDGLWDTYPYLDKVTIGGCNQEKHDKHPKRFFNGVKGQNLTSSTRGE